MHFKVMRSLIYRPWSLYLISFILPIILVSFLYISAGIMPFGHKSIFTLDMTGQYIPLLSYAKRVLLHDHSAILYSFSKGLGGDMFGVWAYYLLNPVNWIFWLFKATSWPMVMSFLTLFNYGSMGMCMAIFLRKTTPTKPPMILIWSLAYAVNAWMLINQLNIIWLLIITMLPLSMWGLYRLMFFQKWGLYVVTMTLMMIANFYMFFMLGTFSMVYVVTMLTLHPIERRQKIIILLRYGVSSLIVIGLSAFIWLPTLFNLLDSKAGNKSYTSIWTLLNSPFGIFQKFFVGAFRVSDIINGNLPIYSGLLTVLGLIGFFFVATWTKKQKLIIAGIMFFYYLTSFLPPLLIILQAGQMPNGYTFRYGLTIVFWTILIASYGFPAFYSMASPIFWKISYWVLTGEVIVWLDNYVEPYQLTKLSILTTIFATLIYLCWLYYCKTFRHPYLWLLAMVFLELLTNGVVTYHHLDFKKQSAYNIARYAKQSQAILPLEHSAHDFYRLQPLQIWTPNDALNYGYTSNSEAVSTFDHHQSLFDWNLGFNSDDVSSIASNNTLFTDKLLGFKYLIDNPQLPNNQLSNVFISPRFDKNQYHMIKHVGANLIYQNSSYLPLGFLTTDSVMKKPNMKHNLKYANSVFNNQQLIFNQVFNTQQALFQTINVPVHSTKHAQVLYDKRVLAFRTRNVKNMDNQVTFKFVPKTNDAYYVAFHTPSYIINPQNVNLKSKIYRNFGLQFKVNGRQLPINSDEKHQIIYNVASKMKNKPVTISFSFGAKNWLIQNTANAAQLQVYRLRQTALNQQVQKVLRRPTFKIKTINNRYVKGSIKVDNDQYHWLTTTIPATHGWQLKVDGKPTAFKVWEHTFITIPLINGRHTIELQYAPPYLMLGILISETTFIISLLLWQYFKHFKRKK